MADQPNLDQSRNFNLLSCFGFAGMGLPFLLLPFCTLFVVSREEVARLPSPNGRLDAVLIETNGGATTSFGYSVRLEEPGWFGSEHEVASLYAALRNDCAYGVSLRWAGPDRLLVEYQDAERANASAVEIDGRQVAVELKPGVTDPAAPCGGMEYNLRGRPG